MSTPLVSIIIVNYNGVKFIKRCLETVLASDYPNFEVIFVDNASTDGSTEMVKRFFGNNSNLKLLQNPENLGFAGGNNVGANHAKGRYLVFLNPDTEVDPQWLKELINVMESDPTVGAAQGKLLFIKDRKRFDSAGHFIDYCGIESYESACITGEVDYGQYDEEREIFYAKGAAMAVKKYIFFKVGMFDPAYFTDHEEIDLCWRIRVAGYRIIFVPGSVVYHHGGAIEGRREANPISLFHLRKNHIISLLKNYELKNVIKYLPVYLVFLFCHGIYKVFRGKPVFILVYLKSSLWVLRNLKYVYSQRLKVQHLVRRVPDRVVMKYMTKPRIPWHFLK